jgi:LysM repeat protein
MYRKNNPTARRSFALASLSLLIALALCAALVPQHMASASNLAATCSTYHTVASGENISSIAAKYNVTVDALATANDLKSPYTIYIGQRLCIPGATTTATTTSSTTTTTNNFTVKAGPFPNWITIATTSMAKKSVYYAAVKNALEAAVKMGTMKTDKNGNGKRTFRIPKQFRSLPVVTICLKNAYTDDLLCNDYTLPQK